MRADLNCVQGEDLISPIKGVSQALFHSIFFPNVQLQIDLKKAELYRDMSTALNL